MRLFLAESRVLISMVLALVFLTLLLRAEQPLPQAERLKSSPVLTHLRPNPMKGPPDARGAETLAQMHVPPGFKVELVVAEPDIHQPIAFAFDERGRLWVAEAYSYPQRQPEGKGLDKIVIFQDKDGDGKFETRKVFAEGLNLVSGLEVGYGGVWVGAAPELLFIPDKNRDDSPDAAPQVLLDGFGFQDTHECLNSFMWGPDGWLYGNQGVFNLAYIGKPGAPRKDRAELRAGIWRFDPISKRFEVFAEGGSNQWGLDYDERGQIFMTHCRSYWGRGGTTHVIPGGHFWNQANANYAPFIIANPPPDFPSFRNYLLASARYDHGAGGAGAPGTDAIYGGHSHVGTMIYFGDNWPEEFRGRLFTHNLHGHQINQQVNRRLGSGFDTVHAGRDQFFCSDPKYVAVDLQYGPDGAVYSIDWYDQQHCHNPNSERWERGSGRIYRMQWDATYQPVQVNLADATDAQLAEVHGHRNEWFVRTARRLLHERAQERPISDEAIPMLGNLFAHHLDPAIRLRALFTVRGIGHFTPDVARRALLDPDEFIRSWGIRFCAEDASLSELLASELLRLARQDPSPVVRLAFISATARWPEKMAWDILETLSQHGEDAEDRNIPYLLWQHLAPRLARDLERGLKVADQSPLPLLKDWAFWYVSTLNDRGIELAVRKIASAPAADQRRFLTGLELALETRPHAPQPKGWKDLAAKLYAASDPRVVTQAERLAAVFGDTSMFPRLRQALGDGESSGDARRHALAVLSRAQDRESIPHFIKLLDDPAYRVKAINLLGRFDSPEIASALLDRFESFPPAERSAALNTLASRASSALALLQAVANGKIPRDRVTSLHIRQMAELKNSDVDRGLAAHWGRISVSGAEKQAQIAKLETIFKEAPLWAFDQGAGRQHFQKLCMQCHKLGDDGVRIGPELTGAGRNGIRYFLENIIDPNAVVGTDYQMTTVDTKDGEVISGLLAGESAETVSINTTAGLVNVPKKNIDKRSTSELSMMPEGLLDSLNEREQIELLKFLTLN